MHCFDCGAAVPCPPGFRLAGRDDCVTIRRLRCPRCGTPRVAQLSHTSPTTTGRILSRLLGMAARLLLG